MLKIVSENFIHALLLFLGLFLKISRWVPLCFASGEKLRKMPQNMSLDLLGLLTNISEKSQI